MIKQGREMCSDFVVDDPIHNTRIKHNGVSRLEMDNMFLEDTLRGKATN